MPVAAAPAEAYTSLFDPEDVAIATATCRSRGVVGGDKPALPRIVAARAARGARILDLGAGREALQANSLRAAGFQVAAIELGGNWCDGVHDASALDSRFDLIYASNVLNVQASRGMLETTLRVVAGLLSPSGEFLANYPQSPRKLAWSDARLIQTLEEHFASVTSLTPAERLGYGCRVLRCRHDHRGQRQTSWISA